MKIEFHNCPAPREFDFGKTPNEPAFLTYKPSFAEMSRIADKHQDARHVIIVGHGGSISSFYGVYNALKENSKKQVHFLNTVDPDRITEIKQSAHHSESVVIAISKSGETVTQLEALSQFEDYPKIYITGAMGPLAAIAEKTGADLLLHPAIGGRFAGFTEVAMLPALMCGFDIGALLDSAGVYFKNYREQNDAQAAADILYQLEQAGIVEVFMPVYDYHLFPMSGPIIQLCHESFGKNGQGQTYFAHEAPESQHHTNQRFFGGRKNVAGWFLGSETSQANLTVAIPQEIADINLKSATMSALNGISLSDSLRYEMEGTYEDAQIQGIPIIKQLIRSRTEKDIGELLAFWNLFAVYSAVLRGVNPFDQPQVESSKALSFKKRLNHIGSKSK